MAGDLGSDSDRARQIRLAAAVIIVTMLVWMGISLLGGTFGWARRWAFLADLAALAAFAWAGIVLYRQYAARHED